MTTPLEISEQHKSEEKTGHDEQKQQQSELKPQQSEQKPQQAEQKQQQTERAVQKTVQTENVSSRGRDQRPKPVDWAAIIAMEHRMTVGDRVRRGPDWYAGNEDGGGLGTVVRDGGQCSSERHIWEVEWDCGTRGTYYMGTDRSGRTTYNLEIV